MCNMEGRENRGILIFLEGGSCPNFSAAGQSSLPRLAWQRLCTAEQLTAPAEPPLGLKPLQKALIAISSPKDMYALGLISLLH